MEALMSAQNNDNAKTANNKDNLLKKWRAFSPNKRLMVAGGGGLCVILLIAVFFGKQGEVPSAFKRKDVATNFSLPVSKDISIEQLAAQLDTFRSTQQEDKKIIDALKLDQKNSIITQEKIRTESKDSITASVAREVRDLRVELETIKSKRVGGKDGGSTPDLSDQLPSDMPEGDILKPAEPEKPHLRVIGGDKPKEVKSDADNKIEKVNAYIPLGTNFEGVLLNGMDAPTSSATKQNPVPALIRLDTDAILPGLHRYDIKECFVIVSGFGVLSTERAQLQTINMSCVKKDGEVIESKIAGYVVGEDGKVGVKGRVVTKQGALLAKTFISGVFGGLAQSLAPVGVSQLNTSPGSSTQYQTPDIANVINNASSHGLSNAATSISKIYLDMAKEMFPVIEIDAMRRVTIVLLKGVQLGSDAPLKDFEKGN
jgi:conjugal transfer pilus assembly protein TraB